MLTHSTGRHGIFLWPTFFLFFMGLFQIAKEKKKEFYLILFTLALTPVLLMTVGSSYRASRLMMYIPLMSFIFVLGVKMAWEIKSRLLRWLILFGLVFSISVAYRDFFQNYFGAYPKLISRDFSPNLNEGFKQLAKLSKEKQMDAYIGYDEFQSHKSTAQFFEQVYFSGDQQLKLWPRNLDPFPQNGLVLTRISGSDETENLMEIPSLQSGQETFFIVGKNNVLND